MGEKARISPWFSVFFGNFPIETYFLLVNEKGV